MFDFTHMISPGSFDRYKSDTRGPPLVILYRINGFIWLAFFDRQYYRFISRLEIELQYHAIGCLLLLCYAVVTMYTYEHNFVMFGDTHKVLLLQPLPSLLVI